MSYCVGISLADPGGHFLLLTMIKLSFIISNVSMARFSAKTCNDILNIRSFYLCK